MQARCDKPDEIRFIAAFKTAYVIYPSVEAARRILYVSIYDFWLRKRQNSCFFPLGFIFVMFFGDLFVSF